MIVNPAGLYGGGAFKVDTTAATNYFLKQKAAEQAKTDALDKYYQGVMAKANSKGMREQDIPLFGEAVRDMQDFYIKNKKDILAGNVQKQLEYDQRTRAAFDLAESSVGALNNTKQVYGTIQSNPDAKERIASDTFGKDENGQPLKDAVTGKYKGLYASSLNVYTRDENGKLIKNPDYQPFDVTQIQYNPKRLSAKEQEDYLNESLKLVEPKDLSVTSVPKYKGSVIDVETKIKGHDKDNLYKIGEIAGGVFDNEGIKYNWKKDHPFKDYNANNATQFEAANKLYKELYGQDIDPNDDKQYYKALAMYNRSTPVTKIEEKTNPDRQSAQQFERSKKLSIFNKSLTDEQKDPAKIKTPLDEIPDGQIPGTKLIVKGGFVYDENGKPYTSPQDKFDVPLPKNLISTGILEQYQKTGTKPILIDAVQAAVKNGVLQGVTNEYGGVVGRGSFFTTEQRAKGYKSTPVAPTTKGTAKPSKKGSLDGLK
jgi:hypothetical protein